VSASTETLVRVLGASVLLVACGGVPSSPCAPRDLAGIEAAYSARMIAAGCTGPKVDTCDAGPGLRAERDAEERSGGCLK